MGFATPIATIGAGASFGIAPVDCAATTALAKGLAAIFEVVGGRAWKTTIGSGQSILSKHELQELIAGFHTPTSTTLCGEVGNENCSGGALADLDSWLHAEGYEIQVQLSNEKLFLEQVNDERGERVLRAGSYPLVLFNGLPFVFVSEHSLQTIERGAVFLPVVMLDEAAAAAPENPSSLSGSETTPADPNRQDPGGCYASNEELRQNVGDLSRLRRSMQLEAGRELTTSGISVRVVTTAPYPIVEVSGKTYLFLSEKATEDGRACLIPMDTILNEGNTFGGNF